MALGTSVGPKGEVIVDVDISAPPFPGLPGEGMQTTKKLLVDTGSEATIIPFANVTAFFGTTTLMPGPIHGNIVGVGGGKKPAVLLVGGTMTVEVGDPMVAGPPPANQPKTCPNMWATPGGIPDVGGVTGLLGKDQLKILQADPRMNIPETRAWLEPRPP